ncbi:hypothetical protein ETC01_13080 [Geobacillus sp. NFOSA3]|uniref:hypothetical protein n=1 Tax=Parageobacillus toebii TaxID=153151 RepID=UPI0009BF4AF8|nr:hypothetical protein [Geobacillus sp. NFOSA3]OQO98457.1 hypothetical protein B1689_16730 [Geobacillus sp. 44C]QNU35828.1 hypothetical protein IC802_08155 [Geobacillus sp. 44C]
MIESIIVCEHTTDDFKPINKKSIFFPNDFSVQILVKLSSVKKDSEILFHWYISSEPDEPIATYSIPLKTNLNTPRYAVGGLQIAHLLNQKEFNIFQKWFVLVEYEGVFHRVEFEIRPLNVGTNNNSYSPISRYSWSV